MDKRITGEAGCLRYLTRQAGGGFWYHKRISQQDRKRKNEAVKGTSGNSVYEKTINGNLKRGNEKVAVSNINTIINNDIQKVWNIVLAVDKYNLWRSDLSKIEIINDKQFIEYTKNGYATTFTVTVVEPYKRWEFDMDNSNMKGHWIGIFTDKGNETQIDFTENVIPKKWFMKPFVKTYLKKQQKQFVLDLKKALE